MEEILPIIFRVSTIQGGAGFLPSAVSDWNIHGEI
jgi:hypothetical protein